MMFLKTINSYKERKLTDNDWLLWFFVYTVSLMFGTVLLYAPPI